MSRSLLELQDIARQFPGVLANDAVTLSVGAGDLPEHANKPATSLTLQVGVTDNPLPRLSCAQKRRGTEHVR